MVTVVFVDVRGFTIRADRSTAREATPIAVSALDPVTLPGRLARTREAGW
jgi:hypothetical protein